MTETNTAEAPPAPKVRKPRKTEPKKVIIFSVDDEDNYVPVGEAPGVREAHAALRAGDYGEGRFHVGTFKGSPFVLEAASTLRVVKG